MDLLLNRTDNAAIRHQFYYNKNLYDRTTVYQFLLIDKYKPDELSYEKYQEYLENSLKTKLSESIAKINEDAKDSQIEASEAERIASKIIANNPLKTSKHALVDNIISFIIGYEEVKNAEKNKVGLLTQKFGPLNLNKERYSDLASFSAKVLDKANQLDMSQITPDVIAKFYKFDEKTNTNGIDEVSAAKLANIMHQMIMNIRAKKGNPRDIEAFVDNWMLEDDAKTFALFDDGMNVKIDDLLIEIFNENIFEGRKFRGIASRN